MGKAKILSNVTVRRGVSAAREVMVGKQEVEVLPVDECMVGRTTTAWRSSIDWRELGRRSCHTKMSFAAGTIL